MSLITGVMGNLVRKSVYFLNTGAHFCNEGGSAVNYELQDFAHCADGASVGDGAGLREHHARNASQA